MTMRIGYQGRNKRMTRQSRYCFKYDPFGRRIEKKIEEIEDGKTEETKDYNLLRQRGYHPEYLTKADDDPKENRDNKIYHGLGLTNHLRLSRRMKFIIITLMAWVQSSH